MDKKLLIIPAAAALLAAGAAATAQATLGGPAPSEAPSTTVEVPTPLEDWCGFMGIAFGPDGAVADVGAAVDASLATASPSPELAYAVQLGGIPAEVQSQLDVLDAAFQQLLDGQSVTDPAAAHGAAGAVDAFVAAECDASAG